MTNVSMKGSGVFVCSGLLFLGLTAAAAHGQSREIPAAAQTHPILIEGATVHTLAGETIENGFVLLEDGLIKAVGRGKKSAGSGVERINAEGLHVYPGLFAVDTRLGLEETGAVPVTHDHTEIGRVTPEVRAAVAVNPDTDLIPVARANGILTALVTPRGGLVSGRCSLLRLDGWTWEDMAIDDDCGLVVSWPRTEPITAPWMNRSVSQQSGEIKKSLEELDELLDDVKAYMAAREHDPECRTDLRYEAMRSVMTGERPLFVPRPSSAGQIESAVAWTHRHGLRIVILGGAGAGRVIPLLKKHDVPVVIGGLHRMPSARHEPYDEPFTLPARLQAAGVRYCIASGTGAAHERNLNHNAATAAAYGLTPEQAMRAVTLSAAEILGVGDRLGSIEAGKSATLIVTTGDPLEIMHDTLVAFVDGRRIDLGSRHKALYAKYREKYRQLGLLEGDVEVAADE